MAKLPVHVSDVALREMSERGRHFYARFAACGLAVLLDRFYSVGGALLEVSVAMVTLAMATTVIMVMTRAMVIKAIRMIVIARSVSISVCRSQCGYHR